MAITAINHEGKTTYLGITAEAERLGVSRTHLWLVLTGQRESKQLKKRIKITEVK
jgi:hypothetical protein